VESEVKSMNFILLVFFAGVFLPGVTINSYTTSDGVKLSARCRVTNKARS
jgi:hypothetical protein